MTLWNLLKVAASILRKNEGLKYLDQVFLMLESKTTQIKQQGKEKWFYRYQKQIQNLVKHLKWTFLRE